MNSTWLYDRTSLAVRAPPAGLEPRLASVIRIILILHFLEKYTSKLHAKSRRLSSLNFLDDEIIFARKFQYTCAIKIDEYVMHALLSLIYKR